MPMLYDVTGGYNKLKWVDPVKLENSDFIKTLKRKYPKVTVDKLCRIVDRGVDQAKPSGTSRLVFTKSGFVVGYSSALPHVDHVYFWDKFKSIFGDSVTNLKAIGTFFQWRISLRNEKYWALYRRETDRKDEITDRNIHICEYWIKDDLKIQKQHHSLKDLMDKWGKKPKE